MLLITLGKQWYDTKLPALHYVEDLQTIYQQHVEMSHLFDITPKQPTLDRKQTHTGQSRRCCCSQSSIFEYIKTKAEIRASERSAD
jgi:hypothetical protein